VERNTVTQKCICCHKEKDIKLFKEKCKTCKLCKWFKKHQLNIPDDWNEDDVKYVIEQIHDSHTSYLNDIAKDLDRPLNDIIILLKDKLELHNIRNQKVRIKVICDNCGKEFEISPYKLKINNFNFCTHECYSKYRSKYYVGEKASVYTKTKCECDNCHKEILIPKNKLKAVNAEGISHNFCNHKCYSEFRSKYYVGNKLYNTGIHFSDEQREQCRINTAKCYADGKIKRNTKPQIIINSLLNDMDIKYQNEKIYKYYSVDNYLIDSNLIIEVMGDYFHANPSKYNNYNQLNKMQQKDVIRDKRKHTYIKKYYNIEILYLWESDILNNLSLCKALIAEYISNNGVLKDYNSFNYQLDTLTNKLVKNKNINPYFI
jgi:hypothetical protein